MQIFPSRAGAKSFSRPGPSDIHLHPIFTSCKRFYLRMPLFHHRTLPSAIHSSWKMAAWVVKSELLHSPIQIFLLLFLLDPTFKTDYFITLPSLSTAAQSMADVFTSMAKMF